MATGSAQFINELIENNIEENQYLEFKRDLPDRSDKSKHEFLKDVTALANAQGGQIIYGISENSGSAHSIAQNKIQNRDSEFRRLLQILDSQVEPRLRGISLEWVIVEDDYDVLVISVPQSTNGPHRFFSNNNSKFVIRNHTHVTEMTYDQIYDAMNGRDSINRLLESQWREWLLHLSEDAAFHPVSKHPSLSIALMPVSAANKRTTIDLRKMEENAAFLINGQRWGGYSTRYNFEGLAIYPGSRDDRLEHLVQVSRFGSLFAFEVVGWDYQDKDIIPSVRLSQTMSERVKKLLSFAKNYMGLSDCILKAGIYNINGHQFIWKDLYGFPETSIFPRDSLEFPDLLISDISSSDPDDTIVRPWLDILWQAHGKAHCELYGDDGELKTH